MKSTKSKSNLIFSPDQFTATEFSSAADKAKFANHMEKFIMGGFKQSQFHLWFYTRLSTCFGHIAHTNQGGFYATWFEHLEDRITFLQRILTQPGYGNPSCTFSDAEMAVQKWLEANPHIIIDIQAAVDKRNAAKDLENLEKLAARLGYSLTPIITARPWDEESVKRQLPTVELLRPDGTKITAEICAHHSGRFAICHPDGDAISVAWAAIAQSLNRKVPVELLGATDGEDTNAK